MPESDVLQILRIRLKSEGIEVLAFIHRIYSMEKKDNSYSEREKIQNDIVENSCML